MTLINANTTKLADAFQKSGFKIRFVGGCVRDFILGKAPKDIDFCTDATPDQMVAVANQFRMRTVETGLKHGTLTFIVGHETFEVTTLRIDTNCDGRHADVVFTKSFRSDAARRDFTMNAMSMDFNGKIYDYFGGREDMKNNVIRFVGKSEDRVREDFLRVLRYFRFAARFNMQMDPTEMVLFSENWVHDGLKTISSERIWSEISKTLETKNTSILRSMFMCGLKDIVCFTDEQFVKWFKIDNIRDAIDGMFVVGMAPEIVGPRMKMSSAELDKLTFLWINSSHVTRERIENMVAEGINRDWVISWASIHGNDKDVEHATNFVKPVFPVRGADLMDIGFKPGPEIGRALHSLKCSWFASRFQKTREDLLKEI